MMPVGSGSGLVPDPNTDLDPNPATQLNTDPYVYGSATLIGTVVM